MEVNMLVYKIYPNGEIVEVEYPDDIAKALVETNPERFKLLVDENEHKSKRGRKPKNEVANVENESE